MLPAKEENSDLISVQETIIDHSKSGGPIGFYSVSGVKFTTARLVAEKVLNRIFAHNIFSPKTRTPLDKNLDFDFEWNPELLDDTTKEYLNKVIETESVQHLDDLVIRRTSIGDNPYRSMQLAREICKLFKWNDTRTEIEITRLFDFYNQQNKFKQPIQTATQKIN